MAASLRSSAALAAALVLVVSGGFPAVSGGAAAAPGPGRPTPFSAQQDTPTLEGIVRGADAAAAVTALLHRVIPPDGTGGPERSGEVDSVTVGPGGEFQFVLPALLDADAGSDVYFVSVEYDGVLYFGSGITAPEQLDSLYVVQVYEAQEVPREGVDLLMEQRAVFIEFGGDAWFATDLIVIHNESTRTLVSQEGGVVWSYPLPPGATEPILGDGGDLLPDGVTFADGRVRVSGPLPPGGSGFMIRYRLESLSMTIPAPGRTALFEVMVREPSPPLRVEGLAPLDVVALEPGSTWRRHGGNDLVDANLILVQTEDPGPPPFEWIALLTTIMLAMGGVSAYAHPRRRVVAGQAPGLGREALILEVARIDDALAEKPEPGTRSEFFERREALLSLIRTTF